MFEELPEPLPRPTQCVDVEVNEQNIADHFFTPYGSWQRPRVNGTKPVIVYISFIISSIADIIERTRKMRINGFLQIVN